MLVLPDHVVALDQQQQHDEEEEDDDDAIQEPHDQSPTFHNSMRYSMRSDSSTLGGQGSLISSRHSDFTLQVSNRLMQNASPPLCVPEEASAAADASSRRPIFPSKVQQKYDVTPASKDGLLWTAPPEEIDDDMSMLLSLDDNAALLFPAEALASLQQSSSYHNSMTRGTQQQQRHRINGGIVAAATKTLPLYKSDAWTEQSDHAAAANAFDPISPLPSPSVSISSSLQALEANPKNKQRRSLLTSWCNWTRRSRRRIMTREAHHDSHKPYHHVHGTNESNTTSSTTTHAQSLLVALAVAAIWTPSNLLAPNLTLVARSLHIAGAAKRDLYLGSYCALASSVLSAPMGAGIGLLADLAIVQRRQSNISQQQSNGFDGAGNGYGALDDANVVSTGAPATTKTAGHWHMTRHALFCWTIAGGAITSWLTGSQWCTRYWQLLVLRIINGGFMTGSVPVAFSIMADWFSSEHRNAASSGLTAMMGLGMIAGQVYAGMTGPKLGWQYGFRVSGIVTLVLSVMCFLLVQEPERGGKEKALQDMLQSGKRYERKLTWSRFWQSMRQNKSNAILIWQGFFSSIPWGIISVFLNDYLSQERGFSVADATFMVVCFGIGCAFGGVLGGIVGQRIYDWRRSWLPLYMAASTMLGILPFLFLLNTHFTNAHGPMGLFLTISGGLIANLPSVNSRPCLINVNPPESRGAALTASNVLVNLGRGLGPSAVTLLVSICKVDRQFAFNVTLIVFWSISALQLVFLSRTLPQDQDAMESELAAYAMLAMGDVPEPPLPAGLDESMEVSIQERMNHPFDDQAARGTLIYVKQSLSELAHEITDNRLFQCVVRCDAASSSDSDEDNDSVHAVLDQGCPGSNGKARQHRSYSEGGSATESQPLVV